MNAETAVREYLNIHPNPSDVETITQATGLRESTVRRTLGHLVKTGCARRAGGGKFTAAGKRSAHG